ncbi:hypothetical protein PspLS_06451 [Pyricularia sp. CBS 133598]|nr:hypothetical protein PspLS_06451 [Pyricularia sp. CBS 133598]
MQFLTAIIISLSALAAAAPMPADKPGAKAPAPAEDDGWSTAAVIPTECADLKDIYMTCVAGPKNPKEGTQQCKYTGADGKPATKATNIKCSPTVEDPGTKTLKANVRMMVDQVEVTEGEQ